MDSIASSIAAGARRAARAGMNNTPATTDNPSRSTRARSTIAPGNTDETRRDSASTPKSSQCARDQLEEELHTANRSTTGAWQFSSPSAAEAAKIFGMKEGFGTAGVRDPSADQIWAIRQMFQHAMTAEGSDIHQDPTTTIDLIRRPKLPTLKLHRTSSTVASNLDILEGAKNDGDQENARLDNDVHPEIAPDAPEVDLGYGFDSKTGLAHEPTNGLENDQSTDTGRPKYYTTMMFGDKRITIDRAPAKLGCNEAHKLWYYDGAKWSRWVPWQNMDFNSVEWIEKLNKYRDQCARRAGWQKKREKTRANYTKAQIEWVFELVKLAGGKTPEKSTEKIVTDFNEKFELVGEHARTKGGMRSLVEKLVREYRDNDGQMAKRPRFEKKEEKEENGDAAELSIGLANNTETADLAESKTQQTEIPVSPSADEEATVAALMGLGARS